MTERSFLAGVGSAARRTASVGRGKLALVHEPRLTPPLRLACREGAGHTAGEQRLLDHVLSTVHLAGCPFPRQLVVDYYVSLKSNGFVVLTGPQGFGKTEFVRLFAEALVGPQSAQYALIPGGASWHDGTGIDAYYRSLQERFGSWRFLELLHDAGDPLNAGKAYFVCFDGLHPGEIDYYFGTLLHVAADGTKRLNLPGYPVDQQPIVPANVYITATVDGSLDDISSQVLLQNAGLIEFRAPVVAPSAIDGWPDITPPPAGFQRLWMRSAVRTHEAARRRLVQILGPEALDRLGCSLELARLLWRGGVVFTTRTLQELTIYIANSFDERGIGLFDPHDPLNNARVAYDTQVIQRVLWRLRQGADAELRHDLMMYLDRVASREWEPAVA